MCLRTIQEIFSRGKTPILVGGTNYYIESVLFNLSCKESLSDLQQSIAVEEEDRTIIESILAESNNNRLVR